MCLAIEYGQCLNDTIKNIKNDVEKLNKLTSEYDLKVSKIYHEIETSNLNAADGYKKYKELQLVLRERRVVKDEHIALSNLLRKLDTEQFECQIHRALQSTKAREANSHLYRQGWDEDINIRSILN